MNYLRMDLKVCEGCGALWLRTEVGGVYCRGCAQRLSEFPAPRMRHPGGRKRRLARASGCAAAANITGGAR
jgi:hypothetical protein